MSVLRFILGDQLSRSMSSLADLAPERDTVLMVEVHEEAVYVRHHKQKIALVLSAMRHFAEDLRREGVRVDYVRLDDRANTGPSITRVGGPTAGAIASDLRDAEARAGAEERELHTRSTRSTLVVPGTSNGTPAVTSTRSPSFASPRDSTTSRARATMAS